MKIIDLTHSIDAATSLFPGTPKPVITKVNEISTDGFAQLSFQMYGHTGTHIDSPAHIIPDGRCIDDFGIESFQGSGVLIDVSDGPQIIPMEKLLPYGDKLLEADFALLYTGWDAYWGKKGYLSNFPVLTEESTSFLCSFRLKGIGLDALSVDGTDSRELLNHNIILRKNILIIENLCHLGALTGQNFTFFAFPIKVGGADGLPVRAIAVVSS